LSPLGVRESKQGKKKVKKKKKEIVATNREEKNIIDSKYQLN